MTKIEMLALLTMLVIVITICIEAYMIRYRTYLTEKKRFTGKFWVPIDHPDEGEDNAFCDLCHGRLGPDKIMVCSCGRRFHTDCAELENCPSCGNDFRHMRCRYTAVMRCPICLSRMDDGYCGYCDITVPRRNGTFHCPECGTIVMTAHPVCRKCGTVYEAKTTKGYMNRVR